MVGNYMSTRVALPGTMQDPHLGLPLNRIQRSFHQRT